MTRRVDVCWIDVNASADELLDELGNGRRDRGLPLLVCETDIEHVLGVVYAEDLLMCSLKHSPLDVRAAVVVASTSPL